MRKIIFFLVPVLCMGIFSCQKQIDWGMGTTPTNNTGGGTTIPPSTNGELLIKSYGKIVGTADTNVSYYTYNSAKKLIALRNIVSQSGGNNSWNGYERNAAGLIIKRKQYVVSGMMPIQGDTAVFNYYYSNDATPKILYSISTIGIMGINTTDSTVYTYNSAGKLTKTNHYTANFLTGVYEETMRNVFSYDGNGNFNKLEQYLPTNGTLTLESTTTFTYDSRTSPYNYTEAESIVIAEQPATTHNMVSSKTVTTIAGTVLINITLNYNSAGKPATGRSIQTYNGTTTTDFTFYYQ